MRIACVPNRPWFSARGSSPHSIVVNGRNAAQSDIDRYAMGLIGGGQARSIRCCQYDEEGADPVAITPTTGVDARDLIRVEAESRLSATFERPPQRVPTWNVARLLLKEIGDQCHTPRIIDTSRDRFRRQVVISNVIGTKSSLVTTMVRRRFQLAKRTCAQLTLCAVLSRAAEEELIKLV